MSVFEKRLRMGYRSNLPIPVRLHLKPAWRGWRTHDEFGCENGIMIAGDPIRSTPHVSIWFKP